MPALTTLLPGFNPVRAVRARLASPGVNPFNNPALHSAGGDTLHLGQRGATSPVLADQSEGWWKKTKTTPVLKNLIAASKEGVTKFFRHGWKADLITSGVLFFLTLPLALIIPGSHLVLLPAYLALARTCRGTTGLFRGLFKPDQVLKNK